MGEEPSQRLVGGWVGKSLAGCYVPDRKREAVGQAEACSVHNLTRTQRKLDRCRFGRNGAKIVEIAEGTSVELVGTEIVGGRMDAR